MGTSALKPSDGVSIAKGSEASPLLTGAISDSQPGAYGTSTSAAESDPDVEAGTTYSVDEEALAGSAPVEGLPQPLSQATVIRIICVLLIAVFVSSADGSLVMATHPIIASEFNALESSSWLLIGFGLAASATQILFGKLSDIYGRKPVILFCYTVFGTGCIIVGLGKSMLMVIFGRVVSGSVAGGILVLVSILITDLIPIRDVATWRAYVNIAATTGRGLGGPVGGWLADVVGWRWSFIGQAPPIFLAIVLCWIYLPRGTHKTSDRPVRNEGARSKLARVDFLGSGLLALLILSFMLPLEVGGVQVPWSHPAIFVLLGSAAALAVLFVWVEKRSKEPILPLELFHHRDAVLPIIIMALQSAAQIGLMFCVPLYFQVTMKASNTEAGAHLFPAVAGNAVGAWLSGAYIKRTGKYKRLVLFATLCAAFSYSLLMLRWHGHTNWPESLYIIPGGFGTGVASNVVFIALQAAVDPAHLAPAISSLYLGTGVGGIVGLAGVSAVLQQVLRTALESRLVGLGLEEALRKEIISSAVSNVEYVFKAKGLISKAIVDSYVEGLWYTHLLSLVFSLLAFALALPLTEYKI